MTTYNSKEFIVHNESQADREVEPVKPSKLTRIKDAAVVTAWIAIPVGATLGFTYLGWKVNKMQLDTARLNLEAAKLTKS